MQGDSRQCDLLQSVLSVTLTVTARSQSGLIHAPDSSLKPCLAHVIPADAAAACAGQTQLTLYNSCRPRNGADALRRIAAQRLSQQWESFIHSVCALASVSSCMPSPATPAACWAVCSTAVCFPYPKPASTQGGGFSPGPSIVQICCACCACHSAADLAYVICTVFFVDGIVTSLQLIAGDRLPLIHSAAFAYVNPTLAVAAHIEATQAFASEHERFLVSTLACVAPFLCYVINIFMTPCHKTVCSTCR